jgi:hypothetical protein
VGEAGEADPGSHAVYVMSASKTDIRVEWRYRDKSGITGYAGKMLDRDERYFEGQPPYMFEIWTYGDFEVFRNELLEARKHGQDDHYGVGTPIPVEFMTKDGYPAYAMFYADETIWTFHVLDPNRTDWTRKIVL